MNLPNYTVALQTSLGFWGCALESYVDLDKCDNVPLRAGFGNQSVALTT
jgi:hypothetical protein